jgi:hypothetical protein
MSEIEKKRSRARQRGARYSLLLALLRLIGCLYHAFFCPCRHCQKMNQLGIYSVDTITTNHIFLYTREFYILLFTFDVYTIIFLKLVYMECTLIKFNDFHWLVLDVTHSCSQNQWIFIGTHLCGNFCSRSQHLYSNAWSLYYVKDDDNLLNQEAEYDAEIWKMRMWRSAQWKWVIDPGESFRTPTTYSLPLAGMESFTPLQPFFPLFFLVFSLRFSNVADNGSRSWWSISSSNGCDGTGWIERKREYYHT